MTTKPANIIVTTIKIAMILNNQFFSFFLVTFMLFLVNFEIKTVKWLNDVFGFSFY